MKRVCAWCESFLGTVDGPADAVTHAICDECAQRILSKDRQSVRQLLNRLDVPVLVVSTEGDILLANRNAAEAVGRPELGDKDVTFGDAIECNNAALPEGCGHTVHCKGCQIRRSVLQINESNEVVEHVAVTHPDDCRVDPGARRVLVRTRKVKGTVYLILDEHAEPQSVSDT